MSTNTVTGWKRGAKPRPAQIKKFSVRDLCGNRVSKNNRFVEIIFINDKHLFDDQHQL